MSIGGMDASSEEYDCPGGVGPTATSRLEMGILRGEPVRFPALDLQLSVNEQRRLTERLATIKGHLVRQVSWRGDER